jgi:iron complex transport system ATP-binding protein
VSAPAGPGLTFDGVEVVLDGRAILSGVSFELEAGELLALVGPNGSGKTTLLRTALGLLSVSSGKVELAGRPVTGWSPRDRARVAAWVPQAEVPYENLRVRDYVGLGRYPHLRFLDREAEEDREATEQAIREADLSPLAERGILEISAGEKQRALYARARAQGAPLLLLDEPTSHLDMAHQLEVFSQLRRFVRGAPDRAVLTSVHDLNLACRFADRILWLHRGRAVALGTPAETVSPSRIREVFGVESTVERRGDKVIVLPLASLSSPPPPDAGALRVHLVLGGGTGLELVPSLLGAGFQLTVGPLNLLDGDAELCQRWNIPFPGEAPFSPIGPGCRERHRALLLNAEVAVLSRLAVGPGNLSNLEDLAGAARRLPVLVLGGSPGEESRDFTGGAADRLYGELRSAGARRVDSLPELLEALRGLERGLSRAPVPGRRAGAPAASGSRAEGSAPARRADGAERGGAPP